MAEPKSNTEVQDPDEILKAILRLSPEDAKKVRDKANTKANTKKP